MQRASPSASLLYAPVIRCRDAFDAVYGASAGAINATYFLTGQRDGVDIYAEDIANKTFCDLGRLVGRNAGGSQSAL
jgi:predicted patatin/cPLA2 family phospholipase